jgi:hypothetical protein
MVTNSKDNLASELVDLVRARMILFRDENNEPYAFYAINGHTETLELRSSTFRGWLNAEFHQLRKKSIGRATMDSALETLAGYAMKLPKKEVFLRIGRQGENIYLDLADQDWNVVEITPSGWRVIQNSPIPFKRPKSMQTLPVPARGGNIEDLHGFLNLGSEEDWTLTLAWILAAYSEGPYPVLVLGGEQGTGKSTQSRVLRSLIDPHGAEIRTKPKDEETLRVAAKNSWILAYDNLSGLQDWLSDDLCRLSTGGGWSARTLYTNNEESIVDAKRPIILNSISDIVTRGDLMDRALLINLPVLQSWQRKSEDDFWREFHELRPAFLGSILDILSMILSNLPLVKLDRSPRMADFAKWITAAEPALQWPKDKFLNAYLQNQEDASMIALEDSCIANEVISLVKNQDWNGTARDLLAELLSRNIGVNSTSYNNLSKMQPRQVANELRRLAPNLKKHGITVDFRKRNGARVIFLSSLIYVQPTIGVQVP